MKSFAELGFDNTKRTRAEARSYQPEMYAQLKRSQKECARRNKNYMQSGFPDNKIFKDAEGNTYKIIQYDKTMGQYFMQYNSKSTTYMYEWQLEELGV